MAVALPVFGPGRTWRGPLIRIVLGQQGTIVRAALTKLLSQEKDLQVIADLAHSDDVLATAMRVYPQVVVVDHALPGTLTIDQLCTTLCTALSDCAVLIMLSRQASATMIDGLARRAPRVGILPVDATPSHLVDGIRMIARGEPVLDTKLAVTVLTAANNPLTNRERQVLRRAAEGPPASDIAAELFLSAGTVRNYLSSSISKTGARTRIEAIRIAHDSGWI
jgi:two-component system response regulator DesR